MAESSEFQALKKISTKIDESLFHVIYSTQCVKAQAYVTNKLQEKAELKKEKCSFFCNANLKLQSEISQAHQEISSLQVAIYTIKNANVELKKELLLAEEEKNEVDERVKNGQKKYDDLWIESKSRYESLSHVQKLLNANNDMKDIEEQISKLENDEKAIIEEIQNKKRSCRAIDRERIIELAEFMTVERPKMIELIKEKSEAIQSLENELNQQIKANDNNKLKEEKANSIANNESGLIMPRLQLDYLDFDNLNVNMEKIRYDDIPNTTCSTYRVHSVICIDPSNTTKNNKTPTMDYISSFFYTPSGVNDANKTQNYAKKKLINILADIKIDQNEAQKMISDVNPNVLQTVEAISADERQKPEENQGQTKNNDAENEEIEEIDLTASNFERIVMPPSQFSDMSLEQASQKEHGNATSEQTTMLVPNTSQEEPCKKQVKFDLSNIVETKSVNNDEKLEIPGEPTATEENSQLDVSDDGFAKMKDMIMKKHNLDLSPQFIYTKNTMAPKESQKPEDPVVISKFFPQEQIQTNVDIEMNQKEDDQIMEPNVESLTILEKHTSEMDVVSSPKKLKITEGEPEKDNMECTFGLNTPMVSSCMEEESMNTTGFEDSDGDYSQYIDSSLFQSPKANFSMPALETQEESGRINAGSQDVPNFMSGLRKTGLSFFGQSKPDSSAQTQGASGFSFNFGGQQKKSCGGIFSLFK